MRGMLVAAGVVLCTTSAADGWAQSAPSDQPPEHPPGYFDLDFTVLDIAASFAGHLGRGFYLGGGIGFLPPFSFNTLPDTALEFFDVHVFGRYEPVRYFHAELGGRVSFFTDLQFCFFGSCPSPSEGAIVGPYTMLAAGSEHVKIATRLEYGVETNTGRTSVMWYPAFLRIDLTPQM
jgi:hypothetical protein